MNKPHPSLSVKECKIQASILLKYLYSPDREKSQQAAKRFQRLPEFKEFSLDEIIQTEIKRKSALAVIACEKGFKSWAELKCQLPFILGGFLNHWFANYEQAKLHLRSNGGFLLPYKNQFFICEEAYIQSLGLVPDDPDWKLIGHDWAHPGNHEARKRLYNKWMAIQRACNE